MLIVNLRMLTGDSVSLLVDLRRLCPLQPDGEEDYSVLLTVRVRHGVIANDIQEDFLFQKGANGFKLVVLGATKRTACMETIDRHEIYVSVAWNDERSRQHDSEQGDAIHSRST